MRYLIFFAILVALVVGFSYLLPNLLSSPSDSHQHMRYAMRFPRHPNTPYALEERREKQRKEAASFGIFHDFTFTDKILESGITFKHHIVPIALSAQYDHGMGLAVADVDGDQKPDVYFVSQMGGNELWRNAGGGTFQDITDASGVAMKETLNIGASFADFDNDGDADLFVTTFEDGVRFFENDGTGKFQDMTDPRGLTALDGHLSGAVVADFDNDGLLDLYVTSIGKFTDDDIAPAGYEYLSERPTRIYETPERAEKCFFLRNTGMRFEEVTNAATRPCTPWSGDATAADLNKDRYPDLFAMNMFGDSRLYQNQKGMEFADKTSDYLGETPWGSMGAKFFDFDNDGDLDLYVTDMHSDMMYDQRMDEEKKKSDMTGTPEAAGNVWGNAFYENQGGARFEEVSDALNLETYWPWGISVGDVNADGLQDVFVTGGMGFPSRYGINSLLLNDNGVFRDAEFIVGIEPRKDGQFEIPWPVDDIPGESLFGTLSSRSSAVFDIDGDGDLDIVTNEYNASPQILISDLTERTSVQFLKLRLVGTTSNKDGLGALVTLYTDKGRYSQYHDGKSGYLSQSSIPLYFGLSTEVVRKIEIQWPSGKTQIVENTPLNKLLTIVEG